MGKTLKKGLSVFLVVSMFFSCIPLGSLSSIDFSGLFAVKTNAISGASYDKEIVKYVSSVSKQSEVSSGYIGIYTADDLYNIRKNPSGKYMLMNNIDMLGFGEWTSFIVNNLTLDGNGFSICNLYSETYGLFTESHGKSTIKNLGLENITINSTKDKVGGFVGKVEYTDGDTLNIENCFVTGYIKGGYCTGGFVGSAFWNDGLRISNCYNFADVTSDSSRVGGFVGEMDTLQNDTYIIEKSLNRGTIKGVSIVGGFVGYADGYGDQVSIEINQCCNYGAVTGTKDYIGGILGSQTSTFGYVAVEDCYNTGVVSGVSGVGGICGKSDAWIKRSYNTGYVNGDSDVDALVGLGSTDDGNCYVQDSYYPNILLRSKYGTGLSPANMKTILCFNNFDFVSVWGISSSVNFGYPYLRALNNLNWAYDGETFNEVKKTYGSFSVEVKDGAGNPVTGAKVSIYRGTEVIASTDSVNGVAKFPGFKVLNNKNATVSAHWDLGNGIELCSEDVLENGVWQGKTVRSIIDKPVTLVVDEPRWNLNLKVMINESDVASAKSILRKYSNLFAQATNGHVIVQGFDILTVSDTHIYYTQEALKAISYYENVDICMVRREEDATDIGAWGNFILNGLCTERGSLDYIDSCYGHPNGIIWCPINNSHCAETLCHESGHYLFGFLDEYASAIGMFGSVYDFWTSEEDSWYYFDTNGNGVIEDNEKHDAYWSNNGGAIPRPGYPQSNFGLMEDQKENAEAIEMSRAEMYVGFDPEKVMQNTIHYFYTQASCEEKMAHELKERALGYVTDYTYATYVQREDYWYAGGENVTFNDPNDSTASTFSLRSNNDISKNSSQDCGLEITYEKNKVNMTTKIPVNIVISDVHENILHNVDFSSENNYSFNFDVDTDNIYILTVNYSENIDDYDIVVLQSVSLTNQDIPDNETKSIELFSDSEAEAVVMTSNVKENITYGDNDLMLCKHVILSEDKDNTYGEIQGSLEYGLDIDYSTLKWVLNDGEQWIELESQFRYDEDGNPNISCNYVGNGSYYLLAQNSKNTVYDVPGNFTVTNKEAVYDREVIVKFDPVIDNVLNYTLYYGTAKITSENYSEMQSVVISADTTETSFLLDDANEKYYFAIQTMGADGGKSEISANVECFGASVDSNDDGLPDSWVGLYGLSDSDYLVSEDPDEDGLTNLQEYSLGTNPINPDTDGDNVLDNVELQNSLNPLEICSDGVTKDYIVVYGNPDLKIKDVTFNESDLTFSVENLSEGKAMRTYISLEVDGEVKEAWRVNADSRSSFDFNVPLDEISGCESLAIKVDENQITNDSDYSNNTFIYSPSSSIAFEKESFEGIKGNNIVPTLVLEPDTANEIFAWSIKGSPNLSIDSSTGVVTSNGIGTGKVTVKTLKGLTATCDVYSVAFEGAEYSEFDSKLINNDTEVAITGYIGDDSSIIIPETIGSLPVTQLASNAFKGCSFNEVTIHSGINSIANNTFSDIVSLERIIVDEANASYCSVDGILYNADKTQLVKYPSAKTGATFMIPETVTSVGAYSLSNCDYIEEITVPESVTSIGNSAISNCDNLKTVNYNAISCSTPSGFSALLYGVFNSSNQIEKVIIGDNVKVIPQYLFYNKSNLSEVIISDNSNLLTIAQCAFYGCSKLTKLDIPETVTTIGSSAFYGCSKLEGIVLPESLTSISSSVFSGCSSLASIKIPETVKTIDASAFYGCSKLKDVVLPETLTTIGTSAFSGCSSLTSIEIPETVTSIPNNCFANCTSLEKIVIPAQVDTIGETSFSGCSNVVIWCYYKSVAHEYAIANSISYKVMELDTEDLIVTGVQETIVEGLQYQITTEISPVDSDETVMYSSSDDNIFSVTDTGLITAKGAGEAILTVASSRGSVSKTFTINVLGLSKDSENTNLYHVRNADDMLTLSTMVNSGVSFAGKIIQLDNDIDLSNIDWTPIGIDSTYVFSGVFDGKNHTITGLNYSTTSNTYSGLFGYIKTGGIKDLTVEGSVSGISRVGMIAGCIFDSALYNCKAIGEVKRIGSGSYGYVGGLIGSALHSVIINCAAETDITVDFGSSSIYYAAVGGIVGAASTAGSDPMCILNSYCIGDISVNGNSYYSSYENYYVGGIAGYLKDDAANNYYFGEITNADEDPIKKIGYAFGYVVPEYTSESDYNGIGTIIVQDNYYLEGKNAIGKIATGDYDTTDWTTSVTEESFSKLIGEGSLVDELNGNKGSVEDIIVAHRDILSNSTWAELVDRINGDSFTVSSWKIGANNLPVNYECDCYRHAESDWVVDVEATCTKEGSKHTYCLVCQETVTTSIIEKAEHKFSDWTETKAATCTEKGSEYRSCTACNSETETRDIDKLGHSFDGEWTTDKAPTCTKNGTESRVCTRCKSEKETRTVDKLGHDFESKWTVDKEATCSKVGSKSHHCSRCDEKSDVTVINKIAHSYRESVQEATCTKDGKKTYNCSACGDSYSEVITAKGHIDQNGDGKCDNCDYIYDNTCDHMCHKSGFMGFIWKIVRFFWKLFKMNPICECGVSHY